MTKGTISSHFVREALQEACHKGIDTHFLLAKAGIPTELLNAPQSRVSPEQYGALWHGLAAALDDEFFGMDSHPMRYGSFSMLCHALLDCKNLGHALNRALRFYSLILNDLHGTITSNDTTAWIALHPRNPNGHARIFAHGTYFVIMYGLACWLTGRRLRILETRFIQPPPNYLTEYRTIFGKNLHFSQTQSMLALEVNVLKLPIVQNGPSTTAFLRKAPANLLVKYQHQSGRIAKIRRTLAELPFDTWPTFEQIAAMLHTTPSTLRRHLDSEGMSFQEIKDTLRRDWAIHLLHEGNDPVEKIAYTLGFREISAFYKAFRKWTGGKPGDYRTRQHDRSAEGSHVSS